MLFENFPYTNFHELNLDKIIALVKELEDKVDNDLEATIIQYINDNLANIVLAAAYEPLTHTIVLKGA